MSLANISTTAGTNTHSQEILKKFQWAIKRVGNEHKKEEDSTTLTQEELVELIQVWEPQRDIICLYVRWSRQLKRNFNVDSIATLLCLSRQCGYTPINFLRKVKTLSILKNQKSSYGVSFHFTIPDRQDINRKRLNKEFLGLSVTLALLQEQVTNAPAVLGKTRMREKGPRMAIPIGIPIEGDNTNQNASIVAHPTVEFHTQASLLNRIWISINHRWLALYLTEHLFRRTTMTWSYQDALVFSFQMMASCGPCRFEFLAPLAGFSLRFPTQESIDLKEVQLQQIWKNPSMFLSYGNSCLTQYSTKAKAQAVLECFQDLRSDIPPTSKKISYNRDSSWIRRWTCLRAYIFHFWLESSANLAVKDIVTNHPSLCHGKKRKRKPKQGHAPTDVQEPNPLPPLPVNDNSVSTELTRTRKRKHEASCTSGFLSITSSRRRPTSTMDVTTVPNEEAPIKVHNIVGPSFLNLQWCDLRLITSQEMDNFIKSYLVIHRNDGIDLAAQLSPLEVYSADHLHDLSHCRLSGTTPFYPKGKLGPVVLSIDSEADCFIDTSTKSYHVAREQSMYFKEYAKQLPSLIQIQQLCRAIVQHGHVDSKRAIGQYRVNMGNGGQNWQNGSPCKLHGLQFEKDLAKDASFNATDVLCSIGCLTEFTWRVMCRLQDDASDHPIAPNIHRKRLYAAHLSKYLNMDSDVAFVDITLVVSSLHPVIHNVLDHKDAMNDTISGYTRTAAFNMVMICDNESETEPTILLLQVICNFRKVIGRYLIPFHKYIAPVAQHARQYLDKWQRNIHSVFAGKSEKIPTAFDRTGFYLDDNLDYTLISISDKGKHRQTIQGEYLLTEINTSRTLSLSMFINPIVNLQRFLKFDQTMELAFACSFLSNPFWFDWSMSLLTKRLEDPNDPYQLGQHPFYDWSSITVEVFGTWQGGPYNRWSPCGGTKETILETFGAHPGASPAQRSIGENKLAQVIAILCEHVAWINTLSSYGLVPIVDMPLVSMKSKCDQTIKAISRIASCQFSHFRLGILTTIISGCGMLKEGRHLRNLMYPVKGAASYKHLSSPVADFMSTQRARDLGRNKTNVSISNDGEGNLQEEVHDGFMQHLAYELGFKEYFRDEMECILCESHPMRSLNCRDWFRKGMAIFDCNENGEYFRRAYGKESEWVKLHPPAEYQFAYVGKRSIEYIPIDATLSYLSVGFGQELRSEGSIDVKFKGRNSRTSGHQRMYSNYYHSTDFHHPSMKMADFYLGSQLKRLKTKHMFVLGDTESAVLEATSCNNLESYRSGKSLYKYLLTLPVLSKRYSSPMSAGCYHMDTELNNDEVTFFPGHLDKPFVHTVWFVPIGTSSFFTVIAVSSHCDETQDPDSLSAFNQWKDRLSNQESSKIDAFLCDFDVQAKKFTGQESYRRLLYLCKPGSLLSFPANECYHATITPKKPTGYPRDLFVFHPLDGIK